MGVTNLFNAHAFTQALAKAYIELNQPGAKATGLTYNGVLQRCHNGKCNARQDKPGARWIINGDELLDRYLIEGKQNRW